MLRLLLPAVLVLSACENTARNQRLGQLALLAVSVAEKRGVISPADAEAIREAKTIVLPVETLPVVEVTSGK